MSFSATWPRPLIRLGMAPDTSPPEDVPCTPVEFVRPVLRATSFDALPGIEYYADTTAGSIMARLPASPEEGDRFYFHDYVGSWATHAFYIDPNGMSFEDRGQGGVPTEALICDSPADICIVFSGGQYRLR